MTDWLTNLIGAVGEGEERERRATQLSESAARAGCWRWILNDSTGAGPAGGAQASG